MVPTAVQLTTIIILLVPGFLSIQIYQKLTQTKKRDSFDSTILSVVFTLFIHGLYTTNFYYYKLTQVNTLIGEMTKKQLSHSSITLAIFYIIGLFICSVALGLLAFVIKDKGRYYIIAKKFGASLPFENLWDEVMFLFSIKKTAPLVIIEFKDKNYAGQIHRSSFDLNKNDRKEAILINAKFIDDTMAEWEDCETEVVYLDLSDVVAIYFSNGKKIINE
jgi:uncharacterized membrane protein required for colicin V production